MTKKFKISILFLILATLSYGQVESELQLTDIFSMEYVSDPQISPDGSKIIYVRNFKDIMTDRNLSNLWIVNFDGTNNRPLTTGNQNDFYARWSHDGKKIIFKSNRKDNKMKLYMMWMDSKETVALTNTPRAPGQVSWSKDDRYLAFTMFVPKKNKSIIKLPPKPEGAKWNSPPVYIDKMTYRSDGAGYLKGGYTQIFTLSTDGGTPRQLTFSDNDHGAPIWANDNNTLYFSANLHKDNEFEPLNSEIYQLNVKDGSVKELTGRKGPDSGPALSPDGKSIAYTGFDDRYQGYQLNQLYIMNTDGSNSRLISGNFDRNIQSIKWAKDGKGLYFQYDDEGDTKIGYITSGGKVSTLVENLGGLSLGRPYNAASYSVSSNDKMAYTLGGTEHPADLGTSYKKSNRRITRLNDDLFSFRKLGKVEEIWWESSYDQRKIQGWVVTPPDFDPNKKYPMILEIHGGPFASYGSVFSAEVQLYAAAGYVVFYTNPRGSTSYGEEFGNLIHHDYPNHDYDDLMSGVDALIEKGYVDDKNLYVTGGSGGGVLTAWIIGKTDRFKAAVVAKPVINWYSFVLYADNPGFFYKYWFANKPWENPENYLKRSPLSYVGNVTTPTMLLTGEEDYRTPIAESEQFYAALKLQKVESAMVRIPGASHGIANRPSNLIAKIASVLAWFDKYKNEE
ncbi:prolyl oligopeptidase family serine peptidase [Leptobacterium flavescens]|uniref:Prolyl oligopeptidase family serine peptidase n=1 Tax=Leptobacterium flavescens TaxID=472055 RepID=A0A6P0URD2_9FLAO|nr:S9 family peptidase [Leptobacterium flavescens]NER15487.1 prolyl oligopeptidase family serine peptidase [Leptobacterium flavescens]